MNISALKAELLATLSGTSNLTATEKQKLRDRAVLLYPAEFQAYLTANTLTDTAANRGKFFIEKTVGNAPPGASGFWSNIWIEGSDRENRSALPTPELFQ